MVSRLASCTARNARRLRPRGCKLPLTVVLSTAARTPTIPAFSPRSRPDELHEHARLSRGAHDPAAGQARLPRALQVKSADRSTAIHAEPVACSSVRDAVELIRRSGGFEAKRLQATWSTARISLLAGAEAFRVRRRISALAGDLLQMAMDASTDGIPPGCIPGLCVADDGHERIEVSLYIEKVDDEGERFLRKSAHAIARTLARLAERKSVPTLQIVRAPVELIRVRCCIDIGELVHDESQKADASGAASMNVRARVDDMMLPFGDSHQPQLAVEHNDHVLEAAAAAALELGLDARIFDTSARAYASRWGSCEALVQWRRRDAELRGQLQFPLQPGSRNVLAGEALASSSPVDKALLVRVACFGLAGSLGFLLPALRGPAHGRRPRLLPPPLREQTTVRSAPRAAHAKQCSSESGVRPAIGRLGGSGRAQVQSR
jgi:hypothetical protein